MQAESAGSIWILALNSAHGRVPAEETAKARYFGVINIGLGGIGGRPGKDGLVDHGLPVGRRHHSGRGHRDASARSISSARSTSPDSGGAGEWRGGLSQTIEIANREAAPFTISAATFDRIHNPAQGRDGGRPGRKGLARLAPARRSPTRASMSFPTGDSLVVELPGGGGFGDPQKRDREAVAQDLKAGLVTAAGVRRDYGHEPA